MATKKEIEKQKDAMRKLGMTEEDIKELLAYDYEVDHTKESVRLEHDLTPEKQEIAKASTITTGKKEKKAPTVYKLDNEGGKRSNRKDGTKEELILKIAESLQNSVKNLEITNPTQQIDFELGEEQFYIKLTRRTKPKK